jgi:hypothetical protein
MLAMCDGFLMLHHNLAFWEISELNGFLCLLLFQFLGIQFLSIVSWINELVAVQFIWFSAKFLLLISIQWLTGHLGTSYRPLGSRMRLMLGLMDVLLRFGISGRTTGIWPLGLISNGSDVATLLLWLLLKTFLGETSVLNRFDLSITTSALRSPFLVSRFDSSDSAQSNSLFSAMFWSRILMYDDISILLFCHSSGSWLRLLLGLVTFCSSLAFQDTLLEIVGLAGLGTDLMVLFFFWDIFWVLGVLKRPETIVVWRHWFGCSLRPGMPLNSPWKLALSALFVVIDPTD